MDAIEAQARLVDDIRAKGVSLIEREDLAVGLAGVAESGERIALQVRLASQVTLEGVVAMQLVALAQAVAHVARPLIDIDRGCAGGGELIPPGVWARQAQGPFLCRVTS